MAWRTRRPLATSYRAFANEVLSESLHPHQRPSVIDALSERDRRMDALAHELCRKLDDAIESVLAAVPQLPASA